MNVSKLIALLLVSLIAAGAQADWRDLLDKIPDSAKEALTSSDIANTAGLSQEKMAAGLKEALDTATEIAVNKLGSAGGFLDNPLVRIPLPEQLNWVEKGLRKIGKEALANDFIATMNKAAEDAVPAALEQFKGAISAMSLEDAKGILNGPDDAATQYFRKQSEGALREQFLPIVQETTASSGATSAYKKMTKKVGSFGSLLNTDSLDVDEYVTGKTLDGLFAIVAQEEARIREDPVARSTELLKTVFGGR